MPLDGTGGSWKHSGFNLFRGEAVVGTHRAELENLAQYILRHLSLWEEKVGPSGLAPPKPPFRLELTYAPVDDDQFYPDESFAE